jgi:D-3-phosphoglycerate dehydrogenase
MNYRYDPVTTVEAASQAGVKLVSLSEIFSRSHVITVHTPLNDETRGLINAAAFERMRDGVIVVNCARGGIIDENALLDALESGKVASAARDVYSIKPPGEHPLVMHPRVVTTPHLGASTGEAQINVAVAVVNQIIDYLEKGIVRNAVNLPSIDPAQAPKMVPYLNLAQRLAQFLGRLTAGGIVELEVEYQGEIAAWDLRPLTYSALVGLLSGFEGTDVNQVNAPMIAQARGIRVLETTLKESELHGSSLVMRTRTSEGTSHWARPYPAYRLRTTHHRNRWIRDRSGAGRSYAHSYQQRCSRDDCRYVRSFGRQEDQYRTDEPVPRSRRRQGHVNYQH